MRKENSGQNSFTKRSIAASMIFSLSGFFLLFCCHLPVMQAANQETESCPLAKAQNSCHKTETDNNFQSFSIDTNSVPDCCTLLPQIFSKARKVESIPQVKTTAETVKIVIPNVLFISRDTNQPVLFRSVAIDRGKTHLKNCVFRI